MIRYELYIENSLVDINEQISIQLTKAIDDVNEFASRNTSFSKQIVLPGTNRNNGIFGHIYELGNNNPFDADEPNIGAFFNVAQTARAELRLNGLLVLKGVFRLIGISKQRGQIEYEGALFGELGGFITAIGNQKLENLDFSAYDHVYNETNIANSWDTVNGSGYYYPLIDYGTYSTAKVDYDIKTFRPALYLKEYIDKIFTAAGYTYTSSFFNSARFKSLIIPHNAKVLQRLDDLLLDVSKFDTTQEFTTSGFIEHDDAVGADFTINGAKSEFTYTGSALVANLTARIRGSYTATAEFRVAVTKNGADLFSKTFMAGTKLLVADFEGVISLAPSDIIRIEVIQSVGTMDVTIVSSQMTIQTDPPVYVTVDYGDDVKVNDAIPRGILQKDLFASVLKMFNLYVTEDKLIEKHLNIEPYIDFYDTSQIDWTSKVARDKNWQIVPMGNLNGRFFEYKYKEDNDFYNEGYKKRFNQSYGDRLFDTGFQFSKDKQTTEIIFASSPLVKYQAADKTVTAIYKKSKGNSVDQEELTDSVIRLLYAKKITGVTSWKIKDGVSDLVTLTKYGYAGHLDDPTTPTFDLNFGAPSELYCEPSSYTSDNLFNVYWSPYIAQIADKDSKILKCYVWLNALEFADLDFAKEVFIDGVRFRINKVEDYDPLNNELVKVELLKVIE